MNMDSTRISREYRKDIGFIRRIFYVNKRGRCAVENNEEAHWASMEQERALVLSWLVMGFKETPDCGCSEAGAMSAGEY